MSDITPEQLAKLAVKMGHENVTIDESGGYGVRRVVIDSGAIFNPIAIAPQAIAIWCWLVAHHRATDEGGVVEFRQRGPHRGGIAYHKPDEWVAAVVTAAVRVAEDKQ
jgi:hypothetical protein